MKFFFNSAHLKYQLNIYWNFLDEGFETQKYTKDFYKIKRIFTKFIENSSKNIFM